MDKIHQKCPQEYTNFVHKNLPFMSARSLLPNNPGAPSGGLLARPKTTARGCSRVVSAAADIFNSAKI